MKTFECKYCNISGLNRRQYFKHTRTQDHKQMFELATQDAKIRTALTSNILGSSTGMKYTRRNMKNSSFKITSECLDEKDQK